MILDIMMYLLDINSRTINFPIKDRLAFIENIAEDLRLERI